MMMKIDWSKSNKEDTHALVRGNKATPSLIFGSVIFVEYTAPHFWLKGVGAVDIGDDAWIVKEPR